MHQTSHPVPKVTVLYVNELGPKKTPDTKLLKDIPWVKDVICADYRYQVGNATENLQFLKKLREEWLRPEFTRFLQEQFNTSDPIPVTEVIKFIPKTLNELVDYYLQKADCIFIAGSIFAPSEKYGNEIPTRPTPDFRREEFELRLISKAKERGIPLLAVCAGTWRLTNAYGGRTHTVPETEVSNHENWATARHPNNLTHLKQNSMLHSIHVAAQRGKEIIFSAGIAQKRLGKRTNNHHNFNTNHLHVNSTHWIVSYAPELRHNTEFQSNFETSATDAQHGTVEGYESKRGAPIIGVQWHPEIPIPEVHKKDEHGKIIGKIVVDEYKTHRNILDSWVESGLTFRNKQEVCNELRTNRPILHTPRLRPVMFEKPRPKL